MAWTSPRSWVASELVTASLLNTHVRDNLDALRAGGIAMSSQAALDFLYASSATQFARLAVGAALTIPRVNAGATAYEFVRLVQAGGAALTAKPGGTIYGTVTTVGCSGSGETTLWSQALPANLLNANGERLEIVAWGVMAADTDAKTLRVKLGATTLLTGSLGGATVHVGWILRGSIMRESSAVQRYSFNAQIQGSSGPGAFAIGAAAEDLTSSLTLAVTGQGAQTNDIDLRALSLNWHPAP